MRICMLYLCHLFRNLKKRGQGSICWWGQRSKRQWQNSCYVFFPRSLQAPPSRMKGSIRSGSVLIQVWTPGLFGQNSRLPVSLQSITWVLWIDTGVCCCQLGIGTCGSCNTMLQTGVTAPTAHSGHHGNRDEHSYLCPNIHWLHFTDKPQFLILYLYLPVFVFSPLS